MSNVEGPGDPISIDTPIARTLGLRVVEADRDNGRIVVSFDISDAFVNAHGAVQGGIVTAMLDATMGPALRVMLAEGQWAPTTDLHVQFLAAATPGRFVGRGRVTRRGRTIGFTAAELEDADGVVVATATATSVIRSPGDSAGSGA